MHFYSCIHASIWVGLPNVNNLNKYREILDHFCSLPSSIDLGLPKTRSWNSLLVDCQTCDRRSRVRIPTGAAEEFSSPELTLCADSYSVSVPPIVTAVALLNMHTPMTQWSQSGLTMPQCRYSVGIYQEMSSHATHQGTLSHSHLSSLSHCGLILA